MQSRDDELDAFKRDINLAEFAASYGYELDRKKSTTSTYSMQDSSGNHLVLSINQASGHWQWFNPIIRDHKGTIVDFVQAVEQVSLGEVRKILRNWAALPERPGIRTYETPKAKKKDRDQVVSYLKRFGPVEQSSYAESRGITQATLTAAPFQGRILKGFKGALIFPHWDDRGLCGYEVKTFGFTSFSSKGFKSLWVSRVPAQLDYVVVAESGIEALSYFQVRQPVNTLFISAGGNWSKDVDHRLQTLFNRYPSAEVVGAFNNDKGGKQQSSRLKELSDACGNRYAEDLPPVTGADWNDLINANFGTPKHDQKEKP